MITEQKNFLELLSDHIAGVSSAERNLSGVDFEKLFKISRQQCLSAIIYAQIKDNPSFKAADDSVQKKYKLSFTSAIMRSMALEKSLDEIGEKLTSAGIEYIPFKGSVIKEYYPAPELRTMGDIDMLIRPENRDETHRIMCQLGYSTDSMVEPVWNYRMNNIVYEIHTRITGFKFLPSDAFEEYFKAPFSNAKKTEAGLKLRLDIEYQLLHILYHTAKHMYMEGCGFRPFVDMALILKNERKALNFKKIENDLETVGLTKFAITCFAFCEEWFGINSPFEDNRKLDREFAEFARDKLFDDGIFGHKNPENRVAFVSHKLHSKKEISGASVLGVVIERFFPPYEYMKMVPKCSFLDGRPWLLPVAWAYRFLICLSDGRLKKASHISSALVKQDEIKKREQIISNWGI